MSNNPKPKPSPGTEDTQQFSTEDVKQAGLKSYRSPRNQQQQTPAPQNTAVQITALLVCLMFVLALIAASTIVILSL